MEIEWGTNWARVVLSGEIDMAWAEQHQDKFDCLCEDGPTSVVVDLEAVTFLDSTGLGLIARLCHVCRAAGGSVYIVKPSENVLKAMEIVGLTQVSQIVIAKTPEEIAEVNGQLAAIANQAS